MTSPMFAPVMGAVFAAIMLAGTLPSDAAADRSAIEGRPPTAETLLPFGSTPVRSIVDDRSELVRERAARRDKRAPGLHSIAAVLAGSIPWALLAARDLIVTGRSRRPVAGTARPLGARSPPLRPA